MKGIIAEIGKRGIKIILENGDKGVIPESTVDDLSEFKIGKLIEVEITGKDEKGMNILSLEKKTEENFEEKIQRYLNESTKEYIDYQKRIQKKKR